MNAACARCRAALPWYARDPATPEADGAFVTAHLAGCAVCRADLAAWRAITAAVAAPRPGDTPPAGSLSRSMATIRPHLAEAPATANAAFAPEKADPQPWTSMAAPQGAWYGRDSSRPVSSSPRPASSSAPSAPPIQRPLAAFIAFAAVIVAAAVVFAVLGAAHVSKVPAVTATQQPAKPPITKPPTNAGLPTNITFNSIAFGTPDDGWAVGSTTPPLPGMPIPIPLVISPKLAHYHAGHWQMVAPPAALRGQNTILTGVAMLSVQEGWAVGRSYAGPTGDGLAYGVILHFHEGVWRVAVAQAPANLWHIVMRSPTDGWAVGATVTADPGHPSDVNQGIVLHYDGTAWQQVVDPAFTAITFTTAALDPNGALWLAGVDEHSGSNDATAPAVLVRQVGATWVCQTLPIPYARLNALAPVSANEAWGAGTILGGSGPAGSANLKQPGHAAIFHWQNNGWTDVMYTNAAHSYRLSYNAIALTSPDAGLAVGDYGALGQGAHGQWAFAQLPINATLNAVILLSSVEGWATGTGGTIVHYDNGAWQVVNGG